MAIEVIERALPGHHRIGHRTRRDHDDAKTDECSDCAQHPDIDASAEFVVFGGLDGRRHQRTFRVASATRTRMTEMIQKRTITRGSGQPLSSK